MRDRSVRRTETVLDHVLTLLRSATLVATHVSRFFALTYSATFVHASQKETEVIGEVNARLVSRAWVVQVKVKYLKATFCICR